MVKKYKIAKYIKLFIHKYNICENYNKLYIYNIPIITCNFLKDINISILHLI